MGNTSQCGFLSNSEHNFEYLGDENHFLYGQIKHFKNQNEENKHFAIKKLRFGSQRKLKQFTDFIRLYQSYSSSIRLISANQYIDSSNKKNTQKQQGLQELNDKQNNNPLFECNKDNFIFKSATQQLSCTDQAFFLTLNITYLQQNSSLKSIINQKSHQLQNITKDSKINQNILLQLENKVKLCDYDKIDKLPHKERTIINLFFTEIQVLRMLDYMLTALYGLRLNGIQAEALRPQLLFKSLQKDELSYFYAGVLNLKEMSNLQKSFTTIKKWLTEQNARFHHNWNIKQKSLVSYIHPDNLERLTQMLLTEGQENFVLGSQFSRQDLETQNIFGLGLMILQICLLEPEICSKIYHVSVCKQHQKNTPKTKKQMKYSFHKQNLTIKLNNSALQKYLIQMKTRYSEAFVDLVQAMVFGSSSMTASNIHTSTKTQSLTYQDVIQWLQMLILENVKRLKDVYQTTSKSKSKSKQCTQKNSRNSSLSRQVSSSGVSNHSLSSSSSLSMLPVQSQQKVLSVQLLKQNCKKLSNRLDKILIKSEIQTLKGSFVKRQPKLEQLISKDEERILAQLDRLNYQKPYQQKPTRFSYRRVEQNPQSILKKSADKLASTANINLPDEQYGNFRLNMPSSLLIKEKTQSQDKQKRINSTTKTKKILLQKAREEQKLGNSVCHTIYLNKSKQITHIQESQMGFNNEAMKRSLNLNNSKNELKSTHANEKEVSVFESDSMQQLGSKSELKNLITIKNKTSNTIRQHSNMHLNCQQKSLKELKSKQLYELYMKEYKNLVNSQKIIKS